MDWANRKTCDQFVHPLRSFEYDEICEALPFALENEPEHPYAHSRISLSHPAPHPPTLWLNSFYRQEESMRAAQAADSSVMTQIDDLDRDGPRVLFHDTISTPIPEPTPTRPSCWNNAHEEKNLLTLLKTFNQAITAFAEKNIYDQAKIHHFKLQKKYSYFLSKQVAFGIEQTLSQKWSQQSPLTNLTNNASMICQLLNDYSKKYVKDTANTKKEYPAISQCKNSLVRTDRICLQWSNFYFSILAFLTEPDLISQFSQTVGSEYEQLAVSLCTQIDLENKANINPYHLDQDFMNNIHKIERKINLNLMNDPESYFINSCTDHFQSLINNKNDLQINLHAIAKKFYGKLLALHAQEVSYFIHDYMGKLLGNKS